MKKLLYAALLVGATLQFTACENDDSTSKPKQRYDLTQGMVIVNEGNIHKDEASISLYYTNGDSLANDVYYKVNKEVLGDVLQSIAVADTSAYLVLNGSNKIVVVSKYSCKKYAMIPVDLPRYMVVNGKTGYVSAWGNDEIAVVNLKENKVTGSIKVGPDPEGMVISNNKLYVANSNGSVYTESNNTISIVDLSDNSVKTVTVADGPKAFVVDKNGAIWVLCAGFTNYSSINTNSTLCKIDPSTNKVTKIDLGSNHPEKIQINNTKNTIYYGGGFGTPGIFQMDIAATAAPTKPFISGDFYGLAINPSNGEITAMIAPYTSPTHKMVRYNNTTGEKIKEYNVGIYPNSGYFFN